MTTSFNEQLKSRIIEALELEDVEPDEVADDAPIFGDGLGLDSIDALELIVLLEKEYGVKFTDAATSRQALSSIDSMARYIREHGTIQREHGTIQREHGTIQREHGTNQEG